MPREELIPRRIMDCYTAMQTAFKDGRLGLVPMAVPPSRPGGPPRIVYTVGRYVDTGQAGQVAFSPLCAILQPGALATMRVATVDDIVASKQAAAQALQAPAGNDSDGGGPSG